MICEGVKGVQYRPFLVAILGLAVAGFGCSPAGTGPEEATTTGPEEQTSIPESAVPVSTQVLLDAADSGIGERARWVIRDEAEWRAFWNAAMANRLPAPEMPEVDFSRDMVLAAALGTRSTGGHDIAIAEVRRDDDLFARVVETSPGPTCMVTQALTAPVIAVRVERFEGEVTWLTETATRPCD